VTKARLRITLATIAASAAVLAPCSAGAVDLLKGDPPPPPPDCELLVKRTLDLARQHPEFVVLYKDVSVSAKLPRLANEEEMSECGDPAEVLRHLSSGH
jgi:hypothetical protein